MYFEDPGDTPKEAEGKAPKAAVVAQRGDLHDDDPRAGYLWDLPVKTWLRLTHEERVQWDTLNRIARASRPERDRIPKFLQGRLPKKLPSVLPKKGKSTSMGGPTMSGARGEQLRYPNVVTTRRINIVRAIREDDPWEPSCDPWTDNYPSYEDFMEERNDYLLVKALQDSEQEAPRSMPPRVQGGCQKTGDFGSW